MNTKRQCINVSIRRRNTPRRGMSMLELIVAGSMLAMVMTSLTLVLRTARSSWEANDDDYGAMHYAHTVSLHFVRQAREAHAVASIASDSIALDMRDGSQLRWRHQPGSSSVGLDCVLVRSSASSEESPLAFGIRKLSFLGFREDGITATTVADDIRLIRVDVTVALNRDASAEQTVSSKVWIRSW